MQILKVKFKVYSLRFGIMLVLMTGLFFSGGEGVRLVPFPVQATAAATEDFFTTPDSGTRYDQAVRHLSSATFKKAADLDAPNYQSESAQNVILRREPKIITRFNITTEFVSPIISALSAESSISLRGPPQI